MKTRNPSLIRTAVTRDEQELLTLIRILRQHDGRNGFRSALTLVRKALCCVGHDVIIQPRP